MYFNFLLELEQMQLLLQCIDPEEMMQRKQPCFPVLCLTQISNIAANFKAKEGRKHDRKFPP